MTDPQKQAREIAARHGIQMYEPPEETKQEPGCECPARKALESIVRWLETECGDTNWPQYEKEAASARAALAAPCSCEQLREENARLKLLDAAFEKEIRIKYQNIVYAARNVLDVALGRRALPLAVVEMVDAVKGIAGERELFRTQCDRLRAERDRLRTERDAQYQRAQSLQDSLLAEMVRADNAVAECSRLQESFRAAAAQSERSRQYSIAAQEATRLAVGELEKHMDRADAAESDLAASRSLLEEVRERYRWRPIAEIHEDYGDVVLVNINDDGDPHIGSNLNLDWDESEWTHFTRFAPIGQAEYERMRDEIEAAGKPEVKP